jgi:hypothetical protein
MLGINKRRRRLRYDAWRCRKCKELVPNAWTVVFAHMQKCYKVFDQRKTPADFFETVVWVGDDNNPFRQRKKEGDTSTDY